MSRKKNGKLSEKSGWVTQGFEVGRRCIARLLREAGLQGVTRQKQVRTTQPNPDANPIPDRVDRDFTASGPEQLHW